MTDQELRDMIATFSATFNANLDRQRAEAEERQREHAAEQKQINRQIQELGKQIGGLGNKFGSFTESLALPSAERLVRERFGADTFTRYLHRRKDGEQIEVDGFGFNNGERNEGYIVEVKSKLDERGLEQVINIIQRFRSFFPAFADKTLYGIIALADIPSDAMLQRAYSSGLYVMQFHDDLMEFSVPENFVARTF